MRRSPCTLCDRAAVTPNAPTAWLVQDSREGVGIAQCGCGNLWRRVRENDFETPWWFPSQTHSGAYRDDRLVLPIPPGTHWRDVMPIVLPSESPKLQAPNLRQVQNPKSKIQKREPPTTTLGRLCFASPAQQKIAKPKREPNQKVKNDPKFVAAARELRDRYLEHINAHS